MRINNQKINKKNQCNSYVDFLHLKLLETQQLKKQECGSHHIPTKNYVGKYTK